MNLFLNIYDLFDYNIESKEHASRVALYSKFLAEELKCSEKFINEIFNYAPLHDIGKLKISNDILKKPERLTIEEFEEVKKHPELGLELLAKMNLGKVAENIAHYHHEKWNGSGYPKGLKEEEIPLEARIVALSDVYDALRESRVYKKSFSHDEAVKIILNGNGTHFDPKLVDIFYKYNEKFDEIFINF
ncbi:HD-GYP domain-containing protein [Cetobacterium sp. 2G large]|uniref:HD-GYP domain-containing protein n=1 Tax=Cetobacterium sp. 2G large TaxID=2759680 RepID=UPI00163BF104|nr:HD-GYP domain-containing protein [Cetobacterium sp. 2G large]MBC2854223.1 HD-GYP domain-containing protein [Cetobacterium sp. 2G large]